MDDSKLGTNWFPSKCLNGFLDLYRVDGNLFFSHMENFQVVVDTTGRKKFVKICTLIVNDFMYLYLMSDLSFRILA